MAFRFWAVITGIVLVYSLLVFRVYDLQMRNGRYFLARAQSEYVSSVSLDAPRGMIYFTDRDSSHFPVVMNKDFPIVYAVPKSIGDIKEAARLLSDTLDIPTVTLLARFSKSQSEYELLKKKVDPAVADAVAKLNIKGVYVDSAPSRFYLRGELAAHLLGYVGTTVNTGSGERGYYGVEEFYNSTLAGIPGERLKGEVIKPRPGKDIVLTIYPNIQLEAERALSNLVEAYKARVGSVIVEDPLTGKILAMGSIPTFDPNYYGQFPIASFLNPVTQNVYEPG